MAIIDEQTDVEGVRMLRLSGSITQDGIDKLEPAFAAALPDGTRAVVDLTEVDLITTPGLALIISTIKRLRSTRGRIVFTAPKSGVRELLRRCRLDEVLELAADRTEAVEKANKDT
jgi:anti-anti-sigma factor